MASVVVVACLGILPEIGTASEGRVQAVTAFSALPVEAQIPILFKLLTYDRVLASGRTDTLRVGVLFRSEDPESATEATTFVDAVQRWAGKTVARRPFEVVSIAVGEDDDVGSRLRAQHVEVVYVVAGLQERLGEIIAASSASSILTLASDPRDVERGLAIGLRLEKQKPRIRVNVEALRRQGHDLGARVLRLCEVVRTDGVY